MLLRNYMSDVAIFIYMMAMFFVEANPLTPWNVSFIWVLAVFTMTLDIFLWRTLKFRDLISRETAAYLLFVVYLGLSYHLLPEDNSREHIEQIKILFTSGFIFVYTLKRKGFPLIELALYVSLGLSLVLFLLGGGFTAIDLGVRYDSTVGNANRYAHYLLVGILVAIRRWRLLDAEEKNHWIKKSLLVVFSLASIAQLLVTTGSRKGVVSVAILLGCYAVFNFMRSGFRAKLATLLVSIFALVAAAALVRASPFYDRIAVLVTAEESFSVDNSYVSREMLRKRAWEMWREHPVFGWGSGQYRYVMGGGQYSHSNVTELLANNGVVGFALYYLPYLLALLGAVHLLRHPKLPLSPEARENLLFCVASILMMSVWEVGSVTYNQRSIWFFMAMVFALLEVERRRRLLPG